MTIAACRGCRKDASGGSFPLASVGVAAVVFRLAGVVLVVMALRARARTDELGPLPAIASRPSSVDRRR